MGAEEEPIRKFGHGTSPRGPFGLAIDPVFGGIFWGKFLSSAGMWVHAIVAAIVVFDAGGSTLLVGMVSVAVAAPQLFLGLLSGKWADRGDAVRQILLGRLLCGAGSGSLAVWIGLSPGAEGAVLIVAVLLASFVVGIGFAVGGSALQSIIPSLIRPGELGTAMALNTAPTTTARIAGPALGAFATVHLGAAVAFSFAAAMHLVFAAIIVAIRFPVRKKHQAGVDYSIRSALRHVRRDRPLLLLLVGTAAVGFGAEPPMTLGPALADELGGGTRLVGEIATTFGLGAAGGLVFISTANRHIQSTLSSCLGLWLMALGLVAVAFSPTAWLALSAFGVAGFGFSWALTGFSTLTQGRTPEEFRGRIMALWMVGFIGSRPFAAAVTGIVADALSVRISFFFAAASLAVIAALCGPRNLAGPNGES